MRLSAGEKLGPYEIGSLIGKGGMGEVYRGTDTRLGRPVAIKVSSREFNDRFEREARAISALNHPNTLYDVGPNYLVMELVEGEMLSQLIAKGPLPLDKALSYAIQIVDALAAAHAKGIIHRDLKPGNIIVTKNGVKVLDFGLAKLSSEKHSSEETSVQTVTEPITRAGAILGTLYYMAPEQVEGKETDERSDIFSFGVVLYEMITGQRPFSGDTQAAVLASLLKDPPPPMSQRQPPIPRALERVVRKCLEKKPDDRWHSARDLKPTLELIDLEAPPVSTSSASVPIPVQAPAAEPPAKAGFKKWLWPATAAMFAVIAGLTAWELWPKPPARATRFQITLPEGVRFSEYVSVSPDGHKLLFNATGDQGGLWIRDLDTLEWKRLTGTERAVAPFWSPDSRYVGFGVGNQLKKIEIAGGPVQTLCDSSTPVGTGAWSRDGVIVFGGFGTGILQRVPAAGGVPAEVTVLDASRGETFHSLPTFLPDGKHFLYLRGGKVEVAGIYAGSLDAKPPEQSRERILTTTFGVPYVNGNLFFMRETTLMAQPFDASKLKLGGEPFPVAEHVGTSRSIGVFSVSSAGVLAYREASGRVGELQTTWFDRQGKATGTFGDRGSDRSVALSPDATRAAVRDAPPTSTGDIWVLDFARGVRTRLTFRQAAGSGPIWSPDGARILFSSGNNGDTLYEKSASGAGEEKELLKSPGDNLNPTSVSGDGRFLLFTTNGGPRNTAADSWVLPLDGRLKPVLLLGTRFNEGLAQFSPDGRWVAYVSNESGRNEVYVRPFLPSGPSLGEGKWQVSKDGGVLPKWRKDGKEMIFSFGNPASYWAVDVNGSGAAFQAGIPKQLFMGTGNPTWDVTGDGQRFLMTVAPGDSQNVQMPITVVLNWQADLKK